MVESDPFARSIGWRGRWLRREPLMIAAVLAIVVVVGIVNVTLHGQHPVSGANAIGGPVNATPR